MDTTTIKRREIVAWQQRLQSGDVTLRRSEWLVEVVGALAWICISVTVLAARSQTGSIRALLKSERPLPVTDVLPIQKAAQAALTDQMFHVTLLPNAGGPNLTYDVQMGASGYPRYMRTMNRWTIAFDHFTGQRARSCAGVERSDELVLGYLRASVENVMLVDASNPIWKDWIDDGLGARLKAVARTRQPRMELLDTVFEMLTDADGISIGPSSMLDGRAARPLIKQHELRPGDYSRDPIPPELQDWLWIDEESLFISRWEARNAGVSTNYGYVFTHDPTLDMTPPHSLKAPTCVP